MWASLGRVANGVGSRALKLHIQETFECHYPSADQFRKIMGKTIRSLLPNGGVGYTAVVKPFVSQQTWSAMIGYFTKDQYKSHYQVETHNIDAQELAAGRQSRLLLSTNYHESDKITLNFKNIFDEASAFLHYIST